MEQQKNNKQENKKTFAKPGYLPEDAPECHADEMALRKIIRNKNKKLNNIAELEQKVEANPDLELNEEQKGKIAAKKALRKEIDDVIKQIKDFQKKQAVIDAEFESKSKDAIANAVKNAVQCVANMVVLSTIANENSESIPEGLRAGVDAFNVELKKALNTANPHADFEWKSALASFSNTVMEIQSGAAAIGTAMGESSTIDEVIVSQHKPVPAAVEQVPAEVEAPVQQQEEPAEEVKEEVVAEQADAPAEVQNEDEQKDTAFERRRGGDGRGRGGRGGRGVRRTDAQRNGEDAEGFKMTNEGNERRGGRGRGRGFVRGFRGGRGGFEGEENFRGGRGGPRGARGARKPRGGAPEDGAPTPAPATEGTTETAN